MKKAAKEAVEENEGATDISIAFDGTWQKRGFKSLNGVFTITSVETGKVLDIEVLSKFCRGCSLAKTEIQKKNMRKTVKKTMKVPVVGWNLLQ